MADNLTITQGEGTTIATDEGAGGEHYQKIKVVDGTADSTNPLVIDNAGRIYIRSVVDGTMAVSGVTGSVAVYFDSSKPTVRVDTTDTITVKFAPETGLPAGANTIGAISNTGFNVNNAPTITGITNSVAVYFDRGDPGVKITSGTLTNITDSIAVVSFTPAGSQITDEGHDAQRVLIAGSQSAASLVISGTVTSNVGTGTMAVYFSPSNPAVSATFSGSIEAVPVTGSSTKLYDDIYDAQRVLIAGSHAAASLEIKGSLTGVTNTVAVYFDRGYPAVNIYSTGVIANAGGSVSGSTSAVSTSGQTIVSPIAGSNIKVYAFSLTTTAQVHLIAKFTDGSGASPSEKWRVALQAPSQGIAGANLAVTPPGFLFASGVGNTLALVLDNASLVHYSVSYFKESA